MRNVWVTNVYGAQNWKYLQSIKIWCFGTPNIMIIDSLKKTDEQKPNWDSVSNPFVEPFRDRDSMILLQIICSKTLMRIIEVRQGVYILMGVIRHVHKWGSYIYRDFLGFWKPPLKCSLCRKIPSQFGITNVLKWNRIIYSLIENRIKSDIAMFLLAINNKKCNL